MLDQTKAQRLREFKEICCGARANTPESIAAQEYFKRSIMMLDEKVVKNPYFVAKENDTALQAQFVDAVSSLVNHINQNELFSVTTYDAAIERLPETHRDKSEGTGLVLHRLALQFRARELPPFLGYGK